MGVPLPANENLRLRTVTEYELGELGRIEAFDRIAAMAAEIFAMPIALVSIAAAEEQRFNGACGLIDLSAPRSLVFCSYAILQHEVMVVPDLRGDPRFARNPLVTGPAGMRFYAGAPLVLDGDKVVGTLCLIDKRPRWFSDEERRRLSELARILVDVIELRRGSLRAQASERHVADAQARLLDALEAVPAAVAIYDADDCLELVNERFIRTFFPDAPHQPEPSITFEEVLRRYASRSGSADVGQGSEAWIAKRLAMRRDGVDTFEIRLQDGRCFRSYERRGRSGMLVAVNVDISDLRQREAEISRQSRLLRATIESISQGLGVFDAQAQLVISNERFFDLIGFPAALRREGTPAREFLRHIKRKATERRLRGAHRGATKSLLEIEMPDGRAFEVARHPMEGGGFVVTYADVTERRQLDRMKDEFVSTVSHELRTPLTSIMGSLRLLGSGAAGAIPMTAVPVLDIAQRNGERLVRLIDDLLEIGRLESGQARLDLAPVELGGLVRQAVEQNRPFADSCGVSLEVTGSTTVWVIGDASRLLQVLANLLSNAIKFSPRGERVEVAVEERAGRACLSVRDRGPGIPEEFRSRIFGRFAQADGSDRRRYGGTGLGLSIVRGIVAAHDGRVGFEAAPDVGTVFRVELPLLREGRA